jgi:hypothetical protein
MSEIPWDSSEGSIPLAELKHGGVYRIRSRNLNVGVFNEQTKGFMGIREKLGDRYLFAEYHWDIGAPFGTVHALEFLGMCPLVDIDSHNNTVEGNKALFDYLETKTSETL